MWAEAQIWAGGGKFVPLGLRTIFLGPSEPRIHLPIIRKSQKDSIQPFSPLQSAEYKTDNVPCFHVPSREILNCIAAVNSTLDNIRVCNRLSALLRPIKPASYPQYAAAPQTSLLRLKTNSQSFDRGKYPTDSSPQ